jgi:hypothetical protein
MVSIDITLTLPDELAREARDRGLLAPEALQRLIDAEVERRRKVDRLFEIADSLAAMDKGDLTEEDIKAEIAAVRAERRARRASRP